MKSGKYLSGGLIKGIGGKGIKSFMKSGLYKDLESKMIKQANKIYSKTPPDTPLGSLADLIRVKPKKMKEISKNLKKNAIKYGKANIIKKYLSMKQGFSNKNFPGLNTNRRGLISIKRGSSNMRKYQKKVLQQREDYMRKIIKETLYKKKGN